MNVLFISLIGYRSLRERDLYTDLLREFTRRGHKVYLVSPAERREGTETSLIREENCEILRVKIGNIQKTGLIEKGISTLLLESQLTAAIRRYFSGVRFDLVLYTTPPITVAGAVRSVKERDHARTYLLLKDIFPQNAVDMGMLTVDGPKGLLYRGFRRKEKELYRLSDRIGCMSPANVAYLLHHNPEIDAARVEVCPNSVEIRDQSVDAAARAAIRDKYGIPKEKTVFVYGGNLGRPQGIPFFVECLKAVRDEERAFFLVVGDGTEYGTLADYRDASGQENFKLLRQLPKEDYDAMVGACDVGLLFLDHRFTIPNFPSRLLSYMQAKLPVLACTDPNTDVGKTVVDNGFGWWCESNDPKAFVSCVQQALEADRREKGQKAWDTLVADFDVRDAYETIVRACRTGSSKP